MDDGVLDRLARRVAATPSRRSVVGKGLAAVAGALAAVGHVGVDGEAKKKKKNKKKGPKAPGCVGPAQLCSNTDECCPATTGRICAQNGCSTPNPPRCCAGIGQPCSGNPCECCGFDLDCVDRKCVYAPRH
jgi:hypothetical protein